MYIMYSLVWCGGQDGLVYGCRRWLWCVAVFISTLSERCPWSAACCRRAVVAVFITIVAVSPSVAGGVVSLVADKNFARAVLWSWLSVRACRRDASPRLLPRTAIVVHICAANCVFVCPALNQTIVSLYISPIKRQRLHKFTQKTHEIRGKCPDFCGFAAVFVGRAHIKTIHNPVFLVRGRCAA